MTSNFLEFVERRVQFSMLYDQFDRIENKDETNLLPYSLTAVFMLQILKLLPLGRIAVFQDTVNGATCDTVKNIAENAIHFTRGIYLYPCMDDEDVLINNLGMILSETTTVNILVLCPSKISLKMFATVMKNRMFFRHANWFSVSQNDTRNQLSQILREGVRVAHAFKSPKGNYEVVTSLVGVGEKVKFKVALFSEGSESGLKLFLKKPIFSDLTTEYANFGGRLLYVNTLSGTMFMTLKRTPNGGFLGVKGVDLNMLEVLKTNLNFKYMLFPPRDLTFGEVKEDGTITGMIGHVARREMHLAIHTIMILHERESVLDFTTPYYYDGLTWTAKAPAKKNDFFAVLTPLPYTVWLLCVGILIFSAPVLMVSLSMARVSGAKKKVSLSTSSILVYGAVIGMSDAKTGNMLSAKVLFTGIFFGTMLIRVIYSGILTSSLVIPSYEPTVDSLQDVIWAAEKGYYPATTNGTAMWYLFERAKSGIFQQIWSLFRGNDSHVPIDFVKLNNKLLYDNRVLFASPKIVMLHFLSSSGRENFHLGKNLFFPHYYGVACPQGAPYVPVLNKRITQLFEGGIVDQWIRSFHFEVNVKAEYQKDRSGETVNNPITLWELKSLFIFYGMGIIISIFGFVVEKIRFKKEKKKKAQKMKNKTPYLEPKWYF